MGLLVRVRSRVFVPPVRVRVRVRVVLRILRDSNAETASGV